MDPRVSILIPTCNRPKYFQQALNSALNQTYTNIEIIVCDNSDDTQTQEIVEQFINKSRRKIKYVRNDQNIGPLQNMHKCFDLSKGEYINYLMDDDLFHPRKIEKMVPFLMEDKTIVLVTSRKVKIDENGECLKLSRRLAKKASILDGTFLGNRMLEISKNIIGEPTTVLLRKKDLKEPFGLFCGKQSENSVDAATWLHLLAKGKAVYLPETLSSFRYHSSQLTRTIHSKIRSLGDWIYFILHARNMGYLQEQSAYYQAVANICRRIVGKLSPWTENIRDPYLSKLEEHIKELIKVVEKNSEFQQEMRNLVSLLTQMKARKD